MAKLTIRQVLSVIKDIPDNLLDCEFIENIVFDPKNYVFVHYPDNSVKLVNATSSAYPIGAGWISGYFPDKKLVVVEKTENNMEIWLEFVGK